MFNAVRLGHFGSNSLFEDFMKANLSPEKFTKCMNIPNAAHSFKLFPDP